MLLKNGTIICYIIFWYTKETLYMLVSSNHLKKRKKNVIFTTIYCSTQLVIVVSSWQTKTTVKQLVWSSLRTFFGLEWMSCPWRSGEWAFFLKVGKCNWSLLFSYHLVFQHGMKNSLIIACLKLVLLVTSKQHMQPARMATVSCNLLGRLIRSYKLPSQQYWS